MTEKIKSANLSEREKIFAEVDEYIDFLATPNEAFKGFAPCPFVYAERSSGKLKYEIQLFGDMTSIFVKIEEWDEDDAYDSMIIAHLGGVRWDEQKSFQHFLNKELRLRKMDYIKCICFHPDDSFSVDGVAPRMKAPYYLVNVAYSDVLAKAHESLKPTEYFDNFTEENKKYLKVDEEKP